MAESVDANPKKFPLGLSTISLSLGTFLNPLNSSMISVALVLLREQFGLDVATVTWVITAFYIASAAGQPLMGRLADRFGPRRLFSFGMILVIIACALAPFSPAFVWVCLARVMMALGTATAFPSSVVMTGVISEKAGVNSTLPLSRIQLANSIGAAIGPVIGGLLVSFVGWQSLFYINVPLALLSLIGVHYFVPRDAARERGKFTALIKASDVPGILAFTATLVALLIGILNAIPGWRWQFLLAGVVFAALFAWRELATGSPFLDLRVLGKNRPLLLIYLSFAVFNGVYYIAFFGLPQYLEQAGHYPTSIVGLLMLPLAATAALVTPLAAKLIDKRGVRPIFIAGMIVLCISAVLLHFLALSLAAWLVIVLAAALGVPYSVVSIAASQGMYASTDPAERGIASGMFQTSRYVGSIGATVLIGIAFGTGVNAAGWSRLNFLMIGIAGMAMVITLFLHPHRTKG